MTSELTSELTRPDPALTASPRRPSEVDDDGSGPGLPPLSSDELHHLAGSVGVRPKRLRGAAAALHADGAVVVPGLPVGPAATAVVAAELLGEHLRQLFPVRHRGADGDGLLDLHADSFHLVHDVHGDLRLERDPDEDVLLMQLGLAPATGGDSVVVDAYALVDHLAGLRPDLHAFMTGVDLDLQGAWRDLPDVPASTRTGGLVEFTRQGRRVVRWGGGIRPLLRTPDHARHQKALDELRALAAQLAAAVPRVRLAAGDVLVLDNDRCWHGRDPFTGPRQLYVQTGRSATAW